MSQIAGIHESQTSKKQLSIAIRICNSFGIYGNPNKGCLLFILYLKLVSILFFLFRSSSCGVVNPLKPIEISFSRGSVTRYLPFVSV